MNKYCKECKNNEYCNGWYKDGKPDCETMHPKHRKVYVVDNDYKVNEVKEIYEMDNISNNNGNNNDNNGDNR